MHETRNFITVLLLIAAAVWAFFAWLIMGESGSLMMHRITSSVLVVALAAYLFYALKIEDKLPDHLGETVGEVYYDADGLSFMPTVRVRNGVVELCVYYQNRYENPVQGIVHLRPSEASFAIRPGARDVHIAFTAAGGDFGAIRQPIQVPSNVAGEVVEIELAAASFYPRSHGARWRKQGGLPCGSMQVDWGGAAFRTGVHEVSGEIAINRPARLRLAMPKDPPDIEVLNTSWRQERLHAGRE